MNERDTAFRAGARRKARVAILISIVLCVAYIPVAIPEFTALYPEATGQTVVEKKGFTLDLSNAAEGYIMMKHAGSDVRLRARVTYDATTTATYELDKDGKYNVFPLSLGSGQYEVEAYEHVEGEQYTREMRQGFQVMLNDPNRAFLYPNVYVNYTPESLAVAKSYELCEGIEDDMDKLRVLYDFVSYNVSYDYVKALTINQNKQYMPDVDETLQTRMGICFDYAALLACMLRVQGIPTKLMIGRLVPTNEYHAWNQAKVGDAWVLLDATLRNAGHGREDYAMERYY